VGGLVVERAGLWEPIEGLLSQATVPLQRGISQVVAQVGNLSQTARICANYANATRSWQQRTPGCYWRSYAYGR